MSERTKLGRGERGALSDQKADLDLAANSPPPSTHAAAAASMRHRQAYSSSSDTSSAFFNDGLNGDQTRSGFGSAQQSFAAALSQVDSSISDGASQGALVKEGAKSSHSDGTSRFDGRQAASDLNLRSEDSSYPRGIEPSYHPTSTSDLDASQYHVPHPYLRNHSAFQAPFLGAPQMERGRNSTDFNNASAPLSSANYRYGELGSASSNRSSVPPTTTSASASSSVHFANDSFSSQLYASRSPFTPTSISMPSNPFFQPTSFQGSPFPSQGAYATSPTAFSSAHFHPFPQASSAYSSGHGFVPSPQFTPTVPIASSNPSLANSTSTGHSPSAAPTSMGPHHASSIGYSWPSRFEDVPTNANDEEKLSRDDRRYAYDATSDDLNSLAPPLKRPFETSNDELYHPRPSASPSHGSSAMAATKPLQGAATAAGRRRGASAASSASDKPSPDSELALNQLTSSSADSTSSRATPPNVGRASKGKRSAATSANLNATTDSKKRSQPSSTTSPIASQSPDTPSSSNSTPASASRVATATIGAAASSSSPDVISASLPNLGPLGADPEARAAVVNAIATIRRSFESAHVLINGDRTGVLTLPHESSHLKVETQPQEYQVKDFNVLPTLVIKVSNPSRARNCDHVAAFLYCDEHLNLDDAFFLAALNARHAPNGELHFNNLRISKEMLHGRTKGFSFVIGFSYITAKGETIDTVYTTPFWLFSNVNQEGFPKAARDSILRPQWRDSSGNFATQKRKR